MVIACFAADAAGGVGVRAVEEEAAVGGAVVAWEHCWGVYEKVGLRDVWFAEV